MANYIAPDRTMPPSRQNAFPFHEVPGFCDVRQPYDDEDEDQTPLYECRICSGIILTEDIAVFHQAHEACVDEGNYFCSSCFQERLESQLLPTCAGCGDQLLDVEDLRRRTWGRDCGDSRSNDHSASRLLHKSGVATTLPCCLEPNQNTKFAEGRPRRRLHRRNLSRGLQLVLVAG